MLRIIAKTFEGKEFLHSRRDAFYCVRCAERICAALNKGRWYLKEGEKWRIYEYDRYMHEGYIDQKITLSRDGKTVNTYYWIP